jgi:hypothetical protein
MNYLELVLNGEEFVDSIDDYVDEWHEGDYDCSLSSFLGLTNHEYALWVESPRNIHNILLMRKHGQSPKEEDWDELHLLAARSQTPHDKDILKEWLSSKGLI